jgi:hypothetical protein
MPEKPEKRKYVQQVGAIRHSREAQRLCIDDVLAFLTGRELYNKLLHRMQALGVMALNRAIERKPYQAWKDERGRASHTPYIDNPDEFIAIVKGLLLHFHAALHKSGRQQGQWRTLWPRVHELHRTFRQTFGTLWGAEYCQQNDLTLLLDRAADQYADLQIPLPFPLAQVRCASLPRLPTMCTHVSTLPSIDSPCNCCLA